LFVDDAGAGLAVVAHAAALGRFELFAEELELHFAAADVRFFAVLEDGVEGVEILFFTAAGIIPITNNEKVIPLPITILIVQYAISLLLIPARSAAFLRVPFE
jgi:hypothetical protein